MGMFCTDFLGCNCEHVENLISENARLNLRVTRQINSSQELCQIKVFDQESNEYQLKKCLESRISEISSWQWIFDDLTKRLGDALNALEHEYHAAKVVVERLQQEVRVHCRSASRPGALIPYADDVEDSILKEYRFLRDQKNNFEKMLTEINNHMSFIKKTKKRIEDDIYLKQNTIAIEEDCKDRDIKNEGKSKKNKTIPLQRWQKRCERFKKIGLKALSSALCTREQIRYARLNLSIAAQADAAHVDSALRRRLHANHSKLDELQWQKKEAIRDYANLNNELTSSEKTLMDMMEQIRLTEAMTAKRKHRPSTETTCDEVSRRLQEDLVRLKLSVKEINQNIENIKFIQNNLNKIITKLDCCSEDLKEVITLDEKRIKFRLAGMESEDSAHHSQLSQSDHAQRKSSNENSRTTLTVILEENEVDDYPFDF